MKILLVGAGGVGEAIVSIAHSRDTAGELLEKMVVCDYNLERAVSYRRFRCGAGNGKCICPVC